MIESEKPETLPKWVLLVWIAIAAFLIYAGWQGIVDRSGWDPDDRLRMVQLRDFLAGQSWLDTTQYRLNPPDGAPMHWSRLIELPLAGVVLLAKLILGQSGAEMLAGTIVPLFCFGLVAWMLGRIALHLGGRMAGGVAVVMTMVSPAISMQLRPMRIDHHGWQLVCAALALWTLFWPNARKAGIAMGLALAIWLHISLEGAPVTAALFAVLGWQWAIEGKSGARLGWTVATFLIASLALFFGTQAGGLSATNFCDTISPAHIWAIVVTSAIIIPATSIARESKWVRIATLAAAGATAIGVLLWQAPSCGQGAFSSMDPVVREYWFVRVSEGMPMWHQNWSNALLLMGVPVVSAAALPFVRRLIPANMKSDFGYIAFLLVYSAVLAALVFRTISVATLIAVPLLAVAIAGLFARYRIATKPAKRVGLVALMMFLLMPGAFLSNGAALLSSRVAAEATLSKRPTEIASEQCQSIASVSALAQLQNANIVAPFDIGPSILLTTPNKVLASSHHRNEKGMRDHIDIYRLPSEQARNIVERRKITHIVACPDEAEMRIYARINPDGLWGRLAKGDTPDWLEAMPDMGEGLKVWRVR